MRLLGVAVDRSAQLPSAARIALRLSFRVCSRWGWRVQVLGPEALQGEGVGPALPEPISVLSRSKRMSTGRAAWDKLLMAHLSTLATAKPLQLDTRASRILRMTCTSATGC